LTTSPIPTTDPSTTSSPPREPCSGARVQPTAQAVGWVRWISASPRGAKEDTHANSLGSPKFIPPEYARRCKLSRVWTAARGPEKS
jgi:hypothetical protein